MPWKRSRFGNVASRQHRRHPAVGALCRAMDWLSRIFEELVARITSGPMQFRLIIQPAMALLLGIHDGLSDAKAGSPPFLWGLVFRRQDLKPSLAGALRRLRIPVILATLADMTVQYLMFHHVRPLTAVIVGVF